MSQPPPKQNLLQTMLIAITLFMAVQIWMTSQQKTGPTPTEPELYQKLMFDDAHRLDQTIVRDKQTYDSVIDDEVKARKYTQTQADAKKFASTILVADAQFKAGIHANDPQRMRFAYNTLQAAQKRYVDQPIWTTPVPVADATNDRMFGWKEWTGEKLYQTIVDRLTDINRSELVYGIFPGYAIIDSLVRVTGGVPSFSYAFAAFLLAFCVRGVVFPLSQRQLMFSRQMSQLTPLVNEIKTQYKDNPTELQKRTMAVYQEYGINPLAGCWPAFIQLPLFLTVYQFMLRYQFAFQKGTFLWINPATSHALHGLVGRNLGQTDPALIIIYAITMLVSTLLTPVTDPTAAKQQRVMSVAVTGIFTFTMFTGAFPVVSGFVLYWVFTNILSTAQSIRAYRLPMPPLVKVNAAGGGVYPGAKNPSSNKWMQKLEQFQQMAEEAKNEQDAKKSLGSSSPSSKWISNGSVDPKPDTSKPGLNGNGSVSKNGSNGKPSGSKGSKGSSPSVITGTGTGSGADSGSEDGGSPSAKHKPKKRK